MRSFDSLRMIVMMGLIKKQNVLITRSHDDNVKLAKKLKQEGFCPIYWPVFICKEETSIPSLEQELQKIGQYDWIIFGSVRSIYYFFEKFYRLHESVSVLDSVQIAVVGGVTAQELKKYDVEASLVSQSGGIKGLVEEVAFNKQKNLKIFLPQAKDARQDFVQFHGNNHQIANFVFYSKAPIEKQANQIQELKNTSVDWVVFYSPSAIDCFLMSFVGDEGAVFLTNRKIAVIGKTTEAHLIKLGLRATVVAQKSSTEVLIEQMKDCNLRKDET